MNKATRKEIKKLANELPLSFYEAYERKRISGEELIKRKSDLGEDLEDISPEMVHMESNVVLVQINHYNRLKRAYKRGGEDGMKRYLKWLTKNNELINSKYGKKEKQNENRI